jgi:geranylgeranyl reductase family protein
VTDVLIVGAGPAGASLATRLARAGLDVLVLDRAAFPRHKPCAEYVSPGTVRLLHELGAGPQVEAAAGARLHGFVVDAGGQGSMRGHFGAAPGWNGAPRYGLGISRALLDTILVTQAREAGARVQEQTRVTDVIRDSGRATGARAVTPDGPAEHRARVVVAADGVGSVVARRLGMLRLRRGMRRLSLVAHLAGMAGLGEHGEMHTGRDGYCGVAPLGNGIANVAMVLRPRPGMHLGGRADGFFMEALAQFGDLGVRAQGASIVRPVLRTGPLSVRARTMVEDGVLLAGDAGGFYDPFTGQGIFKALRSAALAAPVIVEALRRGDVSRSGLYPYEAARRAEFRGELTVEWLIQRFLGRPALFRRAVRLLGERRGMADTLVGVTGDVLPARRVLSPLFLARLAL